MRVTAAAAASGLGASEQLIEGVEVALLLGDIGEIWARYGGDMGR